jgi:hypothetical protein
LKVAIVSYKDLSNDNPTGCLSALRFTNGCWKCQTFIHAQKFNHGLKCHPIITEEQQKLLDKAKELSNQIQKLQDELKALES